MRSRWLDAPAVLRGPCHTGACAPVSLPFRHLHMGQVRSGERPCSCRLPGLHAAGSAECGIGGCPPTLLAGLARGAAGQRERPRTAPPERRAGSGAMAAFDPSLIAHSAAGERLHCTAISGAAVLDPVVLGEDGSGSGVTPVCGV